MSLLKHVCFQSLKKLRDHFELYEDSYIELFAGWGYTK